MHVSVEIRITRYLVMPRSHFPVLFLPRANQYITVDVLIHTVHYGACTYVVGATILLAAAPDQNKSKPNDR